MVKPVQRDGLETIETAGFGAVKGGLIGAVASFAVGAAAVAGIVMLGAAIIPGATIAGAFTGAAGLATAVAATVGGAFTAISGGAIATIGGAIYGGAKGANKANKENAAYARAMQQNPSIEQARLVEAQNAALQQGFQAGMEQGVNAGRQEVLSQLQQAQENLVAQHTDKAAKGHGSHAEMIKAQRKAQAEAGQQLG